MGISECYAIKELIEYKEALERFFAGYGPKYYSLNVKSVYDEDGLNIRIDDSKLILLIREHFVNELKLVNNTIESLEINGLNIVNKL